MSDEGPREKDERRQRAFRNAVTLLAFGAIFGTFGALYYVALGGNSGQGIAGALCTVGFLAVAFLGWEYLMKPRYGLHARIHGQGAQGETDAPPEDHRSP